MVAMLELLCTKNPHFVRFASVERNNEKSSWRDSRLHDAESVRRSHFHGRRLKGFSRGTISDDVPMLGLASCDAIVSRFWL